MWLRFITFCVLVSFVLFIVLSCIHGRPVIHLLFRRCCEDDIENDQVIYENFGNNFLRERLVGAEVNIDDTDSLASDIEVAEMLKSIRTKVNTHDPKSRTKLEIEDSLKKPSDKSIEEKIDELVQTLVDLDRNVTFVNDILIDSHETNNGKKLTSNNEVLSELDSNEADSVEMTTESVRNRSIIPTKLIQLKDDITSGENSQQDGNLKVLTLMPVKTVLSTKTNNDTKANEATTLDAL